MADPLIEVEGLFKVFGTRPTEAMKLVHDGFNKAEILEQTGHTLGLRDINLSVRAGEIFVIMGLSGSGKSTLIRHFNRLIDPTEGAIRVDGEDVMKLSSKALQDFRRHRMSMVFQRFGLLPHKRVIDNVAYGLSIQGMERNEAMQEAARWLEIVGLGGYEKQYPAQLSGGQQQRVGLARALCTNADILLMDEAFSALDPLIRSGMQDQLIQLQEELHKTIIFITHDLDEALRLGDRIAILRDGELVQVGAPAEILLHPADEYVEAFVSDVNRARALTVETVMKAPICRITAETLGAALAQMKRFEEDYGYVVGDDGYRGFVQKEGLESAVIEASPHSSLDESHFEDWPALQGDQVLENVISDTLEKDYPLPVVNEDGELTGILSRSDLAEVLSPVEKEAPMHGSSDVQQA